MTADNEPDTTVEVVEADPSWAGAFEVERRRLTGACPAAVRVEHIGSTSVPGLAAKPTIDVLLVLPARRDLTAAIPTLEGLAYEYVPESFAADPDHLFLHRIHGGKRSHHLHVVAASSPLTDRYLLFRDYLRAQPEAAARYEAVKRDLAVRYPTQRDRYVDEKPAAVERLLAEADRWKASASGRRSA